MPDMPGAITVVLIGLPTSKRLLSLSGIEAMASLTWPFVSLAAFVVSLAAFLWFSPCPPRRSTIKVAAPKKGRVDCDRFSGIRIVRGELVQSPAVGKDATRRRCSSSCFRPALAAAAASEPPEDKTGRIDGRRAQLRPLSFWSDVSARQSVLEFLSVVSARQSAKDGVPRAC